MKISTKAIQAGIIGLLVIVVVLYAYANILPTAFEAGGSLNDSERCTAVGCFWDINQTTAQCNTTEAATLCASDDYNPVPLSGLFSRGGIAFLIIMAALAIGLITSYLKKKK